MKLIKNIIFFIIICIPFNTYALEISAKRAVLFEPITGRVIFEKNKDETSGMASTTKIVTAITAIENGNLNDIVTVSKKAADVEGSSVWLEEGEKQTLENLLYGLMLSSGNDAAIAIAEHISKSTEKFALLMNETAKKAGAKNSSFKNPNGLDQEGHYTTAIDLAKITAYAMDNEIFRNIVSTGQKTIPWEGHEWDRTLKNHNKMLVLYDGADGVKTGFTKKCGRCLVSSAVRSGIRLIAVTLNAPNDWEDHTKMLDLGFDALKAETIFKQGSIVENIKITGAAQETLNVCAKQEIVVPVLAGDKTDIKINLPQSVNAPIKKNQSIGFAEVYLNGLKIAETQLVSQSDVEVLYIPGIWDNFKILLKLLFN